LLYPFIINNIKNYVLKIFSIILKLMLLGFTFEEAHEVVVAAAAGAEERGAEVMDNGTVVLKPPVTKFHEFKAGTFVMNGRK
jgi:hypothetical protein